MPHLSLVWLPSALAGVQRAYRFLADKDKNAAKAAAGAIRKQAAILKKFPHAGRPVDYLDPEHRELLIPFGATGYVLVYEVTGDTVCVLAVKHQKEAGY
ncbi:MAG: type II toxin-antitoxin system RelE/ParE family toxin [Deltaproteobacteria bacterium]|jgi:plasmid stabilization system protein ParE|nr:type II toxin-antitoxin system RelE/ParE family toxin [Deltaproteobacteria bacterium]